ncbi:MAG: hypothetical protein FJ291_11810 [Planctomycetes bacterium]|nr:hypothetical protein [Planctomycetota bacterium]
MQPQSAGFTLIELLASIGIIIFVLSLAILAVGPALRSAGTQDAARRVRAAIDAARVKAIQQRRAVRFEAQVAKDGAAKVIVPEQWGVTPNAGDPTFEWHQLPEHVTLRTNAGSTAWGAMRAYPPPISSLSITFSADASVKAVTVDGTEISEKPPTSQFLIRLHTLREAPDDEVNKGARFIEITPLTGVLTSFGYEEYELYQKDGTGKLKGPELPAPPKS